VVVSAAAARAGVTGSAYTPPASDDAFTITQGSMTANVVVTGGSDLATALAQINTALSAAGLTTLKATDDGGAIRLQESRYGSSILFTVAGGSTAGTGLAGTFAGTNVAGTIGGVAATGTGQALTATTGPAKGLQVKVTATQAAIVAAGGWLPLGSPAYQEGIAGRLSRYLATAEGLTGIVSTSSNRWASQIKLVNEQIATYELRLDQREITLRRQLTAMETAMSKLSQQGSWMTQQLASQ
jgi:flagellar hook-associated protein 2